MSPSTFLPGSNMGRYDYHYRRAALQAAHTPLTVTLTCMCFVLGPEAPEPAPRSRRRGLQARRGRPAEALFGRPRAAEERPRRARRSRPPSAARQQLRRHRACQPACEARPVASRRQHGRIAAQRPRALRSIRADGTARMAPARAAPCSKPAARTGSGSLWLSAEPAGCAWEPGIGQRDVGGTGGTSWHRAHCTYPSRVWASGAARTSSSSRAS